MNKNQVEGGMKEAGGKIQKEFGKAVDSPKHTIKGAAKEVGGKVQKGAGNLQEDAREDAGKDRDRRN